MSSDVLPAAFYRAEADYLTPPFNPWWVCLDECPQCSASSECDECEVCAELNADEPDYEREAEEREEMREERWSRD